MENENIVFGRNPVLELIAGKDSEINKIWISESLQDKEFKEKIVLFAKEKKIPFHFVPHEKLNNLTGNKNHQGILFSISPIKYLTVNEVITNIKSKVILVAHEIEDNYNLGALIRTFAAGGGEGIILTGRSNIGVNSDSIKTSAGAVFQTKIARAVNCVEVLRKLKKNDFWIVGTDNSKEAKSIHETNFPEKVAILVGNEHEGLGKLVKENCDFLVRIPISEKINSLNVSVAFGIVLFEYLRQKHTQALSS